MYRVLLVDDDPHIQAANEAFLKRQGYQIYLAENGPEALDIAATAALDAVVLDFVYAWNGWSDRLPPPT